MDDKRSMLKRLGLGAALLACSLSAVADDQDWIDYRQHIMKTLDEQAGAINMILEHKAPAANLATHAKILALAAATAKQSFETKAPGGNAKPAVWSNWSDFSKQMDVLTAATADLAKAAGGGGPAVTAARNQVMSACKGCHDQYMTPKN